MDPTNKSLKLGCRALKFSEKLCAAVFPVISIIDSLIFAFSGCFEYRNSCRSKESHYGNKEIVRLSHESHFTVNEVEALHELFKKLSSSIFNDGFVHKEELQLALFRTSCGQNFFLDRVFDIFDKKRTGVIDLEEFVHSLSIFHPNAPVEDKIEFAFKLCDLRQTGSIGREEVKQMVIALLVEFDMKLTDELLDQIIEKTFMDADADRDGKINEQDWNAFVARHPSILRNMTLPYLKFAQVKLGMT
ncbi:hypothetical protein ABFX02_05G133300 [Erythranthe guttata]